MSRGREFFKSSAAREELVDYYTTKISFVSIQRCDNTKIQKPFPMATDRIAKN